jgi:putative endonuclease
MSGGWVYIMINRPNGVLYTGVTSDIARRAYEHRESLVPGFTKRYGLKRLVYTERYERITDVIQREKKVRSWVTAFRVDLRCAQQCRA